MSRNTVLLILAVCAFGAWKHFGGHLPYERSRAAQAQVTSADGGIDVASAGNGIVVYGQNTCGYTQNMMASLRAKHVPFTYVNIDEASNRDVLYDRFHGTGLARNGLYLLPVVEVSGHVNMRPDPDSVIQAYRRRP